MNTTQIETKLLRDNVIHVSMTNVVGNDVFEQVYYLDFNNLTNSEHSIVYDYNNNPWPRQLPKQRTKLKLTFENIPIPKLMKWSKEED